jgi:septum formation protein
MTTTADKGGVEQLRTQRAALEALATTLESMEEDARIATREFKSAAKSTREWMKQLQKEQDEGAAVNEAAALQNDNIGDKLTVMLASSSKWRRALIAQILPEGFELSAETPISPDIDEKAIRREDPEDMVKAIANAKADKVLAVLDSHKIKVDMIVCADQVVVFDTTVREKPLTKEQAKEHLLSYGDYSQPAKCITAIVVACPLSQERFEGTDIALQYFKKVPERVADALIAKGDIMHCAGSFVVEDPLLANYLGERVGELESVQGMPKSLTRKLIIEAGKARRKFQSESKRGKYE